MKQTTKTPLEKLVLLILADCHNQSNGRCFPSITYVSEHACCTRKGAIKVIESLQQQGFISAKKTSGKSSFYTFHMEQTGEHSTPVNSGNQLPQVTSTGELSSQTGELSTPEPGITGNINREEDARAKFATYPPDDFWPSETDAYQLHARLPGVDMDHMVETFKQIKFKPPDNWSRRFYRYCLEQGDKYKRINHDELNSLQRKTDALLNGRI